MSASPAQAPVNREIEVGENMAFQRRWWRFEQAAWWVLALLVLADVSGAFGRGPLSKAQWHSADNAVKISYERLLRTGAPSQLVISLDSPSLAAEAAVVYVSDSVISRLGAQRVVPQPARSIIGQEGITYTFPANDSHVVLRLELSPTGVGRVPIRLQALGSTFQTSVMVFP